MRRYALLDACRKRHISGQTLANCLTELEKQGVVQVKRSSRKHVELTLNFETGVYPLKSMKHWALKEWAERKKPTSSWLERPVDLFVRIQPSYERLLSDIRQIKTREDALERIDLYLTVQLNPQLRGHAENFWNKFQSLPVRKGEWKNKAGNGDLGRQMWCFTSQKRGEMDSGRSRKFKQTSRD